MAVSSHRVPVRRQCGLGQQKDRVSHEPATHRRLTRAALLAAMDPLAGASPTYHLSSPAWAALGGQTVQQRRGVAASSAALHQALMGAVPRRGPNQIRPTVGGGRVNEIELNQPLSGRANALQASLNES